MWNVRHKEINQFSNSEDEVGEDDDERKLESEDVPVDRGQVALIVPEPVVVTVRLRIF